jgi:hypothetical protein
MEITKDIPIPTGSDRTIYPFAEMEIGDSVTVAGLGGRKMAHAARAYAARHADWNCISRKLDTGAIRVWRVEAKHSPAERMIEHMARTAAQAAEQ